MTKKYWDLTDSWSWVYDENSFSGDEEKAFAVAQQPAALKQQQPCTHFSGNLLCLVETEQRVCYTLGNLTVILVIAPRAGSQGRILWLLYINMTQCFLLMKNRTEENQVKKNMLGLYNKLAVKYFGHCLSGELIFKSFSYPQTLATSLPFPLY